MTPLFRSRLFRPLHDIVVADWRGRERASQQFIAECIVRPRVCFCAGLGHWFYMAEKPISTKRDGRETPPGVGKCIYCLTDVYDVNRPARPLADEHAVPFGLGGKIILPKACCAKCEGITSAFEGQCMRRIFGPLRVHLRMATRNPKERPETLPVTRLFGSHRDVVEVPIHNHPLMVTIAGEDRPRILAKPDPDATKHLRVFFPIGKERFDQHTANLAAELGCDNVQLSNTIYKDELILTLAKIGHSLAIAYFGLGSFYPFLPEIIRAKDADAARFYVGQGDDVPWDEKLGHRIKVSRARRGRQLLIIFEVGLFHNFGLPVYDVVVGRQFENFPAIGKPGEVTDRIPMDLPI